MLCKNCGAELQFADTFCGECGVKIESQEKEAVKCSECGKFFDKNFGICPFCGTEFEEDIKIDTANKNTVLPIHNTQETVENDSSDVLRKKVTVCPKCNIEYDSNLEYCSSCGCSLKELKSICKTDEPQNNLSKGPCDSFNEQQAVHSTSSYNEETNIKQIEESTKNNNIHSSNHEKSFSNDNAVGHTNSYGHEKSYAYKPQEKTLPETCEMCGRQSVLLKSQKITDWQGTRYVNMCGPCIDKYQENNSTFLNRVGSFCKRHKTAIIIVIVAILLLILIINANSGYTCSRCGEKFSEGYSVFGEPWCKDCFYGH